MKYCSKCENQLIEGLKYCFKCGTDVDVNDSNNVKQEETVTVNTNVNDNVKQNNKTNLRLSSGVFDIFMN